MGLAIQEVETVPLYSFILRTAKLSYICTYNNPKIFFFSIDLNGSAIKMIHGQDKKIIVCHQGQFFRCHLYTIVTTETILSFSQC